MKVKATARGFYAGGLRNTGDEFDVPDGMKSSWWVPVEEPVASAETEPDEKPAVVQDKPAKKKRKRAKKKS